MLIAPPVVVILPVKLKATEFLIAILDPLIAANLVIALLLTPVKFTAPTEFTVKAPMTVNEAAAPWLIAPPVPLAVKLTSPARHRRIQGYRPRIRRKANIPRHARSRIGQSHRRINRQSRIINQGKIPTARHRKRAQIRHIAQQIDRPRRAAAHSQSRDFPRPAYTARRGNKSDHTARRRHIAGHHQSHIIGQGKILITRYRKCTQGW